MIFIIALVLLFNAYVLRCTLNSRKVNIILKVSILFYSAMWLIVPGIGMILVENDEIQNGIISSDIVELYALETILFGTALLAFLFFGKISKEQKPTIKKTTFYFFSILYLLMTIYNIFNGKHDYQSSNNLLDASSTVFTGTILLINDLMAATFIYLALQIGQKKLKAIAMFLVLLNVFSNVLTGARIGFVSILFIVFFELYKYQTLPGSKVKFKIILASYILIFLLFLGVMGMTGSIGKTRAKQSVSAEDITLVNMDATNIFNDLYTKFDSIKTGVRLIKGYGAGVAGFTPYWGSILYFVPRFIYPDKPISGSIDNTYYGIPARLVPALINANDTINNVGVSPLAISIWHWGWLAGPIIIWLTGLLNINLLNYLLNKNTLLLKSLGIYIIPIPGFINIFQSPDVVIKHVVLALLCMILIKFYSLLTKSGNRISLKAI